MNLRMQIAELTNSPLINITKQNLEFPILGNNATLHLIKYGSFIKIEEKKIQCSKLINNEIAFLDQQLNHPKTITKNFKTLINIEDKTFLDKLQKNGYNCILQTNSKNVLEKVGSGPQIIYSYTENRVLKEILDFKKCTLIIMKKTEKNIICEFNIDLVLEQYQVELMNYWLGKNNRPLVPELANFVLNLPLDRTFTVSYRRSRRLNLTNTDINILPDKNWNLYFEVESYLLKEFPELIIYSQNLKENYYLKIIKNDFKYQDYLKYIANEKGLNDE